MSLAASRSAQRIDRYKVHARGFSVVQSCLQRDRITDRPDDLLTLSLSADCQQTPRHPRARSGLWRTKCLVRHGKDGFHRSLKVETRVRTPLGVHVVGGITLSRLVEDW
jgi:hypothetical protein